MRAAETASGPAGARARPSRCATCPASPRPWRKGAPVRKAWPRSERCSLRDHALKSDGRGIPHVHVRRHFGLFAAGRARRRRGRGRCGARLGGPGVETGRRAWRRGDQIDRRRSHGPRSRRRRRREPRPRAAHRPRPAAHSRRTPHRARPTPRERLVGRHGERGGARGRQRHHGPAAAHRHHPAGGRGDERHRAARPRPSAPEEHPRSGLGVRGLTRRRRRCGEARRGRGRRSSRPRGWSRSSSSARRWAGGPGWSSCPPSRRR
jgi:hypothetical protein